jgi:hypothetical protein
VERDALYAITFARIAEQSYRFRSRCAAELGRSVRDSCARPDFPGPARIGARAGFVRWMPTFSFPWSGSRDGLGCYRFVAARHVESILVVPGIASDIVRWIIAIPARRMQRDQHQAGHTIPPSHGGRRASSRRPCCRKESAAASRLSNLAGQESTDWH